MRRILTANRYASVVVGVALVVALGGGTAYAAGLVTSKDIKNGAVRRVDLHGGAVTSAKVKDGSLLKADFRAGQLPAGPAGPAGSAGATGATGPAGAKGDPGDPTTPAKTGDVFSGALGRNAPSGSFMILGDTWPRVLPVGTPAYTLVITTSTTAACPGIGQALTAGTLCVYAYNTFNTTNTGNISGGANGVDARRFGFSIDVNVTTSASPSFFLANWAYRVP
jgi:hypothetical protein